MLTQSQRESVKSSRDFPASDGLNRSAGTEREKWSEKGSKGKRGQRLEHRREVGSVPKVLADEAPCPTSPPSGPWLAWGLEGCQMLLDNARNTQEEMGTHGKGALEPLSSFSGTKELDLRCSKHPSAWCLAGTQRLLQMGRVPVWTSDN